jgi:hypothetical protein
LPRLGSTAVRPCLGTDVCIPLNKEGETGDRAVAPRKLIRTMQVIVHAFFVENDMSRYVTLRISVLNKPSGPKVRASSSHSRRKREAIPVAGRGDP